MLEATFRSEQEPFRREMIQGRRCPSRDYFYRFDFIAALVDYADGEFALEIPQVPQGHHVVAKRAMFETDLIDLCDAKSFRQILISRRVGALAIRVAAAHVQANFYAQRRACLVHDFRGPDRLLWKSRPCGLIELHELAACSHSLLELIVQERGIGLGEVTIGRIQVESLIVGEL